VILAYKIVPGTLILISFVINILTVLA